MYLVAHSITSTSEKLAVKLSYTYLQPPSKTAVKVPG